MAERLTLSIVSPCYNEAEVIGDFYAELKAVLDTLDELDYEIILVDDASDDGTLDRLNDLAAKDPAVRVYSLSRNFGHQIALTAGIDAARGDAVVMLDSDLQHPPQLIPEMVERWRQGDDVVSAVRENKNTLPWFKEATANLYYWLVNRISPTSIARNVADFSLLSRRAYTALRSMREHHRFLRGLVSWTGFKRSYVHYEVRERAAGQSKYTLRRMINFALNGIFSFSSLPLRMATRLGLFVTVGGFVYLAVIIWRAVFTDDLVAGWASLIGVTLVLGGCQILFIGLVGEYLARMFDEVKGRPLYVLKQSPKDESTKDV